MSRRACLAAVLSRGGLVSRRACLTAGLSRGGLVSRRACLAAGLSDGRNFVWFLEIFIQFGSNRIKQPEDKCC